jgi:hypothetical protein
MHLANQEGVYFCLLGGRAIFLDVNRDRYFASPAETAEALTRAIAEEPNILSDKQALEPLLINGLLTTSSDPAKFLQLTTAPPAAAEWTDIPRLRSTQIFTALAFQLRAVLQMRRRGFAEVVLERQRRSRTAGRSRAASEIISAHYASNLILAPHQRCLIKSIGLFDMLELAGHYPRLILGVRDYPFVAHAWVQLEDIVVGDSLDHVALYQPILVV